MRWVGPGASIWKRAVLALLYFAIGLGGFAWAQSPPVPAPALPPPVQGAPPSAPPATGAATDAGAADPVASRLQKLEAMNQQLLDRLNQLSLENQRLSHEVEDLSHRVAPAPAAGAGDATASAPAAVASGDAAKAKEKPKPKDSGLSGGGWEKLEAASAAGDKNADVALGKADAPRLPYAQEVGNRLLGKIPLKSFFDYGNDTIGLATEDDEFSLRFRGLVQAQYMGYLGPTENPVTSGFYLPRSRFYFQGNFTKPLDYQLSFQQGYGSFAVLNAYLRYKFSDRFKLQVGRFKAPYTYEWYKLNAWRFTTPERSLFAENFGLNRMLGLMGSGEFLDKRVEYAVGIFDGPRNSFTDYNNSKDVIAYLNFQPFRQRDSSILRNLSVGGSVDYGNQNNPLTPAALRTNTNASSSGISGSSTTGQAGLPFLTFNNNVTEQGNRELWELHLAYFYRGLSLYAAWDGGFNSYAAGNNRPVRLPVNGYHVTVGYLITGETTNERTLIDPIRRFDIRRGKFGIGAWEPFARYSELTLGSQVFTGGLADPNLWTNRAQLVDVGVNWYLNKATRVIFDWEHSMFGNPVRTAPDSFRTTNDLLWVRFQLYY